MNKPTKVTPRWFTLKDASVYSGLNQRTLQNYIAQGLIVSSSVQAPGASRGRRLVSRKSLDQFIEQGVGRIADLNLNK